MSEIVDFRMEDVVRLRKAHPCGGFEWTIVRLGADIGLKCATCGHRVLLDRRTLEKRPSAPTVNVARISCIPSGAR